MVAISLLWGEKNFVCKCCTEKRTNLTNLIAHCITESLKLNLRCFACALCSGGLRFVILGVHTIEESF
jgi:hypothetical protein